MPKSQLNVYLDDDLVAVFKRCAERDGEGPSIVINRLVRAYLEEKKAWPPKKGRANRKGQPES